MTLPIAPYMILVGPKYADSPTHWFMAMTRDVGVIAHKWVLEDRMGAVVYHRKDGSSKSYRSGLGEEINTMTAGRALRHC